VPTSSRKSRARWRALTAAADAIAGTEWSPRGLRRDGVEHLPQRGAAWDRRACRDGELGLPARRLQEHHELAGDRARHLGPLVRLRRREREVDPGADPGRGDQLPVPDEDRVRFDVHIRMAAGQEADVPPVRRRAAVLEQPEPGQDERARAHRRQPGEPL
jgi:hypothetical protein